MVDHLSIDKVKDISIQHINNNQHIRINKATSIEQGSKPITSTKEGSKNIKGDITGPKRKNSIEEQKKLLMNFSGSKELGGGLIEMRVDFIRMIQDSIMRG